MIYQLNIYELCKYLVPKSLRKPKHAAWVKAILKPLQTSIYTFYLFASQTRYELRFNGQQVYLEHLLNDRFDFALRRIYIDDPVLAPHLLPYIYNKSETNVHQIIYNKSENKPPKFLYNKSENSNYDDFIVFVPASLYNSGLDILLKQLVNKYKLCDKHFKIQTF